MILDQDASKILELEAEATEARQARKPIDQVREETQATPQLFRGGYFGYQVLVNRSQRGE